MHPPYVLNTRDQGRALVNHGHIQKILRYLADLQLVRPPVTLRLIERAGVARTVVSDRMVQIEAAKSPSAFLALVLGPVLARVLPLATRYRANFATLKSACAGFSTTLQWANKSSAFGLDEGSECDFIESHRPTEAHGRPRLIDECTRLIGDDARLYARQEIPMVSTRAATKMSATSNLLRLRNTSMITHPPSFELRYPYHSRNVQKT